MTAWKRICCGIDFSDASRLALDESAYWARTLGADLTLLHVHEEPSSGWDEGSPAQAMRDAEAMLVSWRCQAEFLADRPVQMALLEGNPQDTIVGFARDGRFDLIVVGTYGRRGFKERVLGSVAEHVVRLAHCPVLVVRHRRREWLLAQSEDKAGGEDRDEPAG